MLLPQPVVVIGVARGGELGGMTAAWVTRVSHAPPLLVAAVGHQRHTLGMLGESREFTVSVLAADQPEIARIFGFQSRRDVDKWTEVDHVLLGSGVPALGHCSARLLCAVRNRLTTGDHDLFVGEIVEAEVVAGPPALPLRPEDYRS